MCLTVIEIQGKETMTGRNAKDGPGLAEHDAFRREGPGKRFIEPRILYLLQGKPAHGYEIVGCMEDIPLPGPLPDTGAVYRKLRQMEEKGLLASRWEDGDSGPKRRIYRITAKGKRSMVTWAEAIEQRAAMLIRFVRLCDEKGI
jgi:poly-beta-hydroxybutyrate-responsive repressor